MTDKDTPFLKRWSKQKLADDEAVVEIDEANAVVPMDEADESAAVPPEVDLAALPDLDTLDAESDFTGFLQAGVPEQLKRAALRKLWTSSPELAVLDGLNDYDEDFSIAEGVIETVVSAYKAGKGYLDDADEDGDKIATEETPEIEPPVDSEQAINPENEQNQDSVENPPED